MRGGGQALRSADIYQRIFVSARLVIFLAEWITCEQDHQARVFEQVRFLC